MNLRVKCCGSTPEGSKLMQQSLLYGKALEVARKGNEDFETYDIVMKYFQMAEKEVDELLEFRRIEASGVVPGDKEAGYSESQGCSDGESISGNRYGAAGSSLYTSDDDVLKIKAPPRPALKGRPRVNRHPSLLDRIKKPSKNGKTKKDNGTTRITPHCTTCETKGQDKRTCPQNKNAGKKVNKRAGKGSYEEEEEE
ncbi:transposon protein, putative, unclassified, expressed [Panicum miliaceum]|uniref:Transposon protein, putative, unclassified, expressed n=1 Tax=Panicum miliaceum TaxID=4540 RepID=A0A3L6RPW9_PANMI|nr:transposon protein, putative, unclassified, expressed [Panicum miliaceum]